MLIYFKYNLFLYDKAEFFASLLQSSVSHDPSEIILICWFAAPEHLLLSMMKAVVLVFEKYFCEFFFFLYLKNCIYLK